MKQQAARKRFNAVAVAIHRITLVSCLLLCLDLVTDVLLLGWAFWTAPGPEADHGITIFLSLVSYTLTAMVILCSILIAVLASLSLCVKQCPRIADLRLAMLIFAVAVSVHFVVPSIAASLFQ
jgi:hypothetical protein